MSDATFEFDYSLNGLPYAPAEIAFEQDAPPLESFCGPEDLQDVELYDGTLGVSKEFVRRYSNPVCRIRWDSDLSAYDSAGNVAGASFGTGTLVGPNLILTASHVFEEDPRKGWRFPRDNVTGASIGAGEAALNMHVEFRFQKDPQGVVRTPVVVPIIGLVDTRPGGLDAALVQLATSPGGRFGWTELAERAPRKSERVTVIQHPGGTPKKIESGTIGLVGKDSIGYGDLDTMGGSSGSAVIDRLGRLIGVHVTGGCDDDDHLRNYATRVDRVLDESADFREALAPARRLDASGTNHLALVWAADPDGSGYENIAICTINEDGSVERISEPWNQEVAGHQLLPRVASKGASSVVVWEDDADENGFHNLLVAGTNPAHDFRFTPMIGHANGAGQQLAPSIGIAADGAFVLVWQDDADRNGYYNVFARGFDAAGSELFRVRMVHDEGAGQQLNPRVAIADNGCFIVVWEDDRDRGGQLSIRGQRFGSDGTKIGDDFAINKRATFQQLAVSVSISPDSRQIAVAWEGDSDNNRFYNVRLRSFDFESGEPVIREQIAHLQGAGQQRRPSIAVRNDGTVVVAWEDDADRNGFTNVCLRSIAHDGGEIFSARIPHRDGSGNQRNPVVSLLDNGTITVAMEEDRNQNGLYTPLVCGLSSSGTVLWNMQP